MSLTFPNSSRSYDLEHKRVRFVGHDGMFQISFSISVDAVSHKRFDANDAEAGYLHAFDAALESIHEIARKAYKRTRKSTYAFTADDV
jgi:hypothetical protein